MGVKLVHVESAAETSPKAQASETEKGEIRNTLLNSKAVDIPNNVSKRIIMATAQSNADILTGIRTIIENQIATLKGLSLTDEFTPGQCNNLFKLAQAYQIVATQTDKEQQKYDLSGEDTQALQAAESAARRLLGQPGNS